MPEQIARGTPVTGRDGVRIGIVDAAYVDYLLVRTAGLLPVDLYVPRPSVTVSDREVRVDVDRGEAYERWHRPLKRAPHD